MLVYNILADMVVAIHAAYVAFVVFGFVAIVLGVAMGWGWVRNLYFRAAHLAAILLVCIEAAAGLSCPLTRLEDRLRLLGGNAPYPGAFVARMLDWLIFYDLPRWVFTLAYLAFGALVLPTFVVAPPGLGPGRKRIQIPRSRGEK